MNTPIRWGILGLGNIAKSFAQGLTAVPDAKLVAVGSRSADKAKSFASEFGATRIHDSYAALANDPQVDVIYVATPHPMHKDDAILCLNAGKAVLCEKPFTVNARELETVIAVARQKKVFLMEAMWTRCMPVMAKVRAWLASQRIGEPRLVTADFGFRCAWDPQSRLLAPSLAGGGLLDVGIYTIAFAAMVFGPHPSRVTGFAHLGETGVDEQAAYILGYPGGGLASLTCGVRTDTPHLARIDGTAGRIEITAPFWQATRAVLTVGNHTEVIDTPHAANGYEYEAIEVGRCLRAGLTESPIITLDESLALLQTLDRLRAQFGLTYPMDGAKT